MLIGLIISVLLNIVFICLLISKSNTNYKLRETISDSEKKIASLDKKLSRRNDVFRRVMESNLTSIPFLAGIMSDFLTYDIEVLAKKLDWGASQERAKKVESIRLIRADAKNRIEEAKVAIYQLEYLKNLYPALDDVLSSDYREVKFDGKIPEYDPVRNYISSEQWKSMSESERNQLALDNYILSRKKSKWQVGRDYELYVGYVFSKKGYSVDCFGSYMGLEDLGRDIIAIKDGIHHIIQCKYWSSKKEIHEKHIAQLFGTTVSYSIEKNIPMSSIRSIFITSTTLSSRAKEFAKILNVKTLENFPIGEFPRIKCNIGHGEFGQKTKIYHLPMDQQYDNVKICFPGEFFAMTVKEAEDAGFRRAYRWLGD